MDDRVVLLSWELYRMRNQNNNESGQKRIWEHSLIKKIFAQKQREKSQDRDNLLSLISHRLYGEKIHYALELIQNAEDEDSSSITFIFTDDGLRVINNGNAFDEKDVWRICSVRPGEKKRKIGFFGIGFKSVFNVTKKPQIISGKFNFEIEKLIYPRGKHSIPKDVIGYYSPDRGAIFVLPYCDLSTPEELIGNFNLLDDKILLFLESIEELKLIDNINNDNWTIKKCLQDDSVVSLLDMRTEKKTKWMRFHKVLGVEDREIIPEGKEGIEETKITIAFPLDNATRDEIRNTGVVYCFLPTKRRTDLPFLIQADFLPTIGRENISDHAWNIWLMKELGILAAESIDEMKHNEQFCASLYDFIPLSEEIQDVLIRHLFESFFETIKGKQIAETTKGWVKPSKCAIPTDERLRQLLTESDLNSLLGEEVFYLKAQSSERARKVLLELEAKIVEPRQVVDFLKRENEIRNKSKEWFLNLYEYLSTFFDTEKRWYWDEETEALFEEFEKTKFILTEDNDLVSLKNSTPDRIICYPQPIDVSEVLQLFTEGEIVFLNRYFQEASITRRKKKSAETEKKRKRIKEWFDSIGVKKYFKQSHIIKTVILPKFTTGKYKKYSDQKLYGFVDYVRRYWPTIESEIKNKKLRSDIIKEIKSSLLFKIFSYEDGRKIDGYRNPEEIYFSRRYGKNEVMEELFEGIDGIHFLSSYYLNREKRERQKTKKRRKRVKYTWRKFFELLGVWSSPRVVKEEDWVSISGKEGYEWIEKEYSPSGVHEIYGDSYSHNIKELIDHCSKMDNEDTIQDRMHLLWQSLEKHWKIYKEKYCKAKYRWFYHTYQPPVDYETSSFLEFLRNAKWVPGEEGGFYRPCEMFKDTRSNRFLIGHDAKYVPLKADETFLKDLGVTIQPLIEEVTNHLRTYKEKNPKPAENKIEKMNAIYVFLKDKISGIEETENRNKKIREIREMFNESELIYLPREDKAWWKPINVFWKDCSDVFGTLRGYNQHNGAEFYSIVLKEFFSWLGVVEKPLVKECLDVLEELKVKGNIDLYKKVASRTYIYLNKIVKQGLICEADWEREVFLSEKGLCLKTSELYYNDRDEYKEYLGDMIEILWLPFSWSNVRELLHSAGFRRLSENIIVTKKFGDVNEIEGDVTNQLIQRLSCVEAYLRRKNVELHRELQKEGVFERINGLQAFETSKIILDYALKRDNPEPILINNIERDVYLSVEENRIYKSSQTELFSTSVAKELSKLFVPGEEYVFPFLDSLFGANSDEELDEKLKHFGVKTESLLVEASYESVRIVPSKEEEEELKPEREVKKPKKPAKKTGEKPQLPESELDVKRSDLINPDKLIFETVEERTPYLRTEGAPTTPVKAVKLKKAYAGGPRNGYMPRKRVSRRDAEGIALEIVMRFEEMEDREPDDRHTQRSIGYDIYSKTKDGRERFIEVKHFRGDTGTFELKSYQWKKAENEKDKYFVYIMSGLREGGNPKLEIIQNPVKYLTPNPPIHKTFNSWKNGVKKIVGLKKV